MSDGYRNPSHGIRPLGGTPPRDAKSGRYGRYISATFLAGANSWAILDNFGSFLGYFGSFWVIFGPNVGANFLIYLCYFYYFLHLCRISDNF